MSALAEASSHFVDDRLAKRNAIVLAVAQALAGANNTVIVATAGIIGSVIAPDKGLATLPISVMVFGIWLGTLPIGLLSRTRGRRTALQIGSVSGILGGLICCAAVLQGSFWLFCSAPSAAASTRRDTCHTASPQPTLRAMATNRRRSPTCWRAGFWPA